MAMEEWSVAEKLGRRDEKPSGVAVLEQARRRVRGQGQKDRTKGWQCKWEGQCRAAGGHGCVRTRLE